MGAHRPRRGRTGRRAHRYPWPQRRGNRPATLDPLTFRPIPSTPETLAHDVLLRALDEGKHLRALRGRNLETVQGHPTMACEAAPIGFADAHAAMGGLHIAADIEQGP